MQAKMTNQSDEHVGERCGGQYIREVRPGEGGHIAGEEGQEEKDSQSDPGIEDGQEQGGGGVQRNTAEIFHAACQQGIAGGAEDGDACEDEVFAEGQLRIQFRAERPA